jgi:hypothetical protein
MQDRLNFFEPWERLPAKHENQLTRALLVVLRCCPIAHQTWLSLVDRDLALRSLPRPTFDTQRGKILRNERQPTTDEPIKGISVLCAADASNGVQGAMLESDREQVLDGIIRYGNDIVIVLESKLDGPPDDHQARNINLHGQPIFFDDQIRRISWRDVLACFTDLVDEQRSLVSGAEREILNDFLDFIDRNFPQLGPFNTIGRCAGESSRVQRRLDEIISKVLDNADRQTLPGIHKSVKLARLIYESEHVTLRMWPADTLEQARLFYQRPDVVDRILKLQDEGWSVSPNFHFGFMAKGDCYTDTTLPLADYMRHWLERIGDTGKIKRGDWDQYWRGLVHDKIATTADRELFDSKIVPAGFASATPRPGLKCTFNWSLSETDRLDARAQLGNAVRDRINQLLEALREDKINPE